MKRYRQYDSLPGFNIDQIAARSFVKSVLEWNLPPIRFEDVGTPSFYLSSARTALFTGMMVADPGSNSQRTLNNVGVQVDWNFTIALRLPMTFSIGYAAGIEHGTVKRNELMASLKIM